MSDPKAQAGERLDEIVRWSRRTFIATAPGALAAILAQQVLVVTCGYLLHEYRAVKATMASAAAELDKATAQFNITPIARK